MNATKIALLILAILLAFALIWWCRSDDRASEDASRVQTISNGSSALSSSSNPPTKEPAVTLLKQMMEGRIPELSAEQLKAFVEKQNHSAGSLLAAWLIGQNSVWLDEAAQRYPDDPRVALAKLSTMNEMKGDAREWIERLKKNDPTNGLGWCYDSMNLLKDGATEEARFVLAEAVRLGRFTAYADKSSAGIAAAYASAGYDELSAGMMGMSMSPLPHAQIVLNLQKEWLKLPSPGADEALIQDMLHLSRNVSGQSDNRALIMHMVGSSMERKLLNELYALELVPGTKKLVIERMEELDQEKNLINDLIQKALPLMSSMSEAQWKQYFRRYTVEGELKAMQWLLKQHPEAQ